MAKIQTVIGISLIAFVAACAPSDDTTASEAVPAQPEQASVETVEPMLAVPPAAPRPVDATATLINRSGDAIGTANLYQGTDGVVMRLSLTGLSAGPHGMHFHTIGTCEDPQDGFMTTGGHIMPFGKPHGYMHPEGPHAGNLPNLMVHEDGTATVELHTHIVSLFEGPAALLDEDGSTLIIHESEDDHLTQPIGGAGGRLVCGVIERPSQD